MSTPPKHPNAIVIDFSPEHWNELERFFRFWETTYKFNFDVGKRLSGIQANLRKGHLLIELIHALTPLISEDEDQLERDGYSPAIRSKQIAAVVEATICCLYSSLDCLRYVLVDIYPRFSGVKNSTRGLFQNAFQQKLDSKIPADIRIALQNSEEWFNNLRRLRDEVTHSNVGYCSRDKTSGKLFYMHSGLGNATRALILNDISEVLIDLAGRISNLLEAIFHSLNTSLVDAETRQNCGIFRGRIHERFVKPSEATNFHAGVCKSFEWFEKEENPTCPFAESCGAYQRIRKP